MSSAKCRGNEYVKLGRINEALQAYSEAIWSVVRKIDGKMPEVSLECSEIMGNVSAVLLGIVKSRWQLGSGHDCNRSQHKRTSSELLIHVEALCCFVLHLLARNGGNHVRLAAKSLARRATASGALSKDIFADHEGRMCAFCGRTHREPDDNAVAERLMIGDLGWPQYASSGVFAALSSGAGIESDPSSIAWHDAAVIEKRAECGRGVFASRSLSKGTVIIQEPILVFQPLESISVCHTCSIYCSCRLSCSCHIPLPLPSLTLDAVFCSWRCLHAGTDARPPSKSPIDVQLAAKISRRLPLPSTYAHTPVQTALSSSLLSLQSHTELLSDDDVAAIHTCYKSSAIPLSEPEFVQVCSAVRCNAVAVRRPVVETNPSLSSSTAAAEEKLFGTAVLPAVAMLNHSCDPNCVLSFDGDRAIVAITRDVVKDEQLCISYGPLAYTTPVSSQRQSYLRDRYGFTCTCASCRKADAVPTGTEGGHQPVDGVRTGMKCTAASSCRGQLVVSQDPDCDTFTMTCEGCRQTVSEHTALEVLESASTSGDLFDTAMAAIEGHCSHGNTCGFACEFLAEAKSSVEDCVRIRRKLYVPTAAKLAAAEDLAARVYAEAAEYRMAAKYCEAATARVATKFGPDSVEVGAELTKLAQLLCLAGDLARARTTAIQGMDNLAPVASSRSADLRELERIIAECST